MAQPFSLKNGFTRDDATGCQTGIQAVTNVHPRLSWISFPVGFHHDIMAKFYNQVAEHQIYYKNFFVIANPWTS